MDFLEVTGRLYAVPVPSGSQSPDQGDKTSLTVVGQGTIWGGWRRATGNVAGTAQGAGTRAGGDSGTCDLIR